jgi:predicted secreted protein
MSATITVTECDDDREIDACVGDTIEVHLPENAAGGYRWTVEGGCDDRAAVELTGTSSNYPREAVGSAGEAVFAVRVRATGRTRLRLTYGRPWEGEDGVRKTFSIIVHATENVGGRS